MMEPKVMFRRVCNMRILLLTFICWSGVVGCATGPQHSRPNRNDFPEATVERISLSPAEVQAAITPANVNLSRHGRKVYAKRAAEGDIEAARTLARYYATNHEGPQRTKRDDEKADYWNSVVARLENAASKARRAK